MLKLLIDNDITNYIESNDVTKEVADMIFEFNADERRKRRERMELVNEISLNTLKEVGKREGLKEGLEQGLEQGREQGLKKGAYNTADCANVHNTGNTKVKVTGLFGNNFTC